jgi:5-methylcytosine-specific restriction protein A
MAQRTFLLTWNPSKWNWPDDEYQQHLELTSRGIASRSSWSTGSRKSGIQKGDRAFLLRQHSQRGIVASGVFESGVEEGEHWDGSDSKTHYAEVAWDRLLSADARLPIEVLKAKLPEITWDRVQGSGNVVHPAVALRLEALWGQAAPSSPIPMADDVQVQPLVEGAVTQVMVNRYERNPAARLACIAHWGTTCKVCGFDFGKVYGDLGSGYIHVHHLRELASIGQSYTVDPIDDLRPVCANCHAMLHRQQPALTLEDLERVFADNRP